MVAPRALAAALLAVALTAAAGSARADDRAAAATAYDRATAAFEAGRFREAADEFRRADELAPSAAALEGAITAAVRADDPALVMALVTRAEARRGDPQLDAVAADARARFAGRVATTPPAAPPGEPGPGASGVPAPVPSASPMPGGPADSPPAAVAPPSVPPPSASPPSAPRGSTSPSSPHAGDDGGPAPGWFFVGLGATALLGGAAVATGVATLSHHDDFESAPTDDARDTGLLLQNTTNGLLVGAAVAGVVTVVLAAVVDWSGDAPPQGALLGPGQPAASLRF